MATYSLSGSGVQTLSVGVVALNVTITTLPSGAMGGLANPTDYYGIGLLRAGNASAFWEAFTILGGPQWMGLPNGTTRLAYALNSGAVISVAEVFTPNPLAWPLASLPDVALSGPTDTQVLTYQASSAKWINANAPSGGGGSGGTDTAGITVMLLDYHLTADKSMTASTTFQTWDTWTFTPVYNNRHVLAALRGQLFGQNSGNHGVGAQALLDSTTQTYLGGAYGGFQNYLNGINVADLGNLSTTPHTLALQLVSELSELVQCRASSRPLYEHLALHIFQ